MRPTDPFWAQQYDILCRTESPDVAADLLQRTKLKILAWRSRGGQAMEPDAIVVRARRCVHADWIRQQQRERRVFAQGMEAPDVPAASPDAAARLERDEWCATVRRAALTAVHNDVERIVLLNWHETADHVARVLGTSASYVRNVRSKLKKRMAANPELRRLLVEAPGH